MQKEQQQLAELVKGKKVAFIGAGVSHKTLIEEFVGLGAQVTLCDKKDSVEDFGDYADTIRRLGIDLSLGEHYMDGFKGQDIILRTPGFEYYQKPLQDAIAAGTMVTSEVELFFDYCPCEIVGVTGSDGKTTTTTLIAKILEHAGHRVWIGGNIGAPLLPQAAEMTPTDLAVVELSSFQLMSMERSADIAVVTNVAPNHLDVHKDMAEYVQAKKNVFAHQDGSGKVVLNYDNDITRAFAADAPGAVEFFSRQARPAHGVYLEDGTIFRDGRPIMDAADIRIPGVHNIENYMAAACAVEGLATDEDIDAVARSFAGVEHRIEFVREKDGVKYYNDSIASSPSRTIAGLHSFHQKLVLIAGGYDKKIPFDALGPEICGHVRLLILCGATAEKIEAAVCAAPEYQPGQPEILHAATLAEAVQLAQAHSVPGDIVTLSPACAAFDQFKNFMVRGETYKRLVQAL